MQYFQEFRNPEISQALLDEIEQVASNIKNRINIMEICGGHTYAIFRFGINKALPEKINLISGPGCPVCVTSQKYIDEAIEYSKLDNVIIVTFGDIVRVPGSYSSLLNEKASGADVRICYSPMEALVIARENPDKEIVFLGIGFETTVPLSASIVLEADIHNIENFSLLSAHKTIPEALNALFGSGKVNVDALICPGHVSAITGFSIYTHVVKHFNIPSVICGFESNDILQTILMLLIQCQNNTCKLENQYTRGVKKEGNKKALALIKKTFQPVDAHWRGIGNISSSGLEIADDFTKYNTRRKIPLKIPPTRYIKGCICGEIMQGIKKPTECKLFAKQCVPQSPQGACMVSSEGSCATYFKFRD